MKSTFRAWAIVAVATLAAGCGSGPGDSIGESNDALRVCAKGAVVEGIDVSTYQGVVNWPQVAGTNVRFAVTRISDGLNFRDVQFDRNWPAIKNAGLIRGAYQFFEPGQDPLAQANMVVDKVGKLGAGDLPVQLDMEVTGGQSSATIVARMKTWIDRVTAGTGKRPMIYSAKYFWNDNIVSRDFNGYSLWVANYGVTCPDMPDPWSNWTIWQYGDNRTVTGISGAVDADRFNGTLDDLKAFAGATSPPGGEAGTDDASPKSDAVAVVAEGAAETGADAATPSADPGQDAAAVIESVDAGAPAPDAGAKPAMQVAANVAEDPGCACRTTTTRRTSWAWLLLAVLPWLRRSSKTSRRRVALPCQTGQALLT